MLKGMLILQVAVKGMYSAEEILKKSTLDLPSKQIYIYLMHVEILEILS